MTSADLGTQRVPLASVWQSSAYRAVFLLLLVQLAVLGGVGVVMSFEVTQLGPLSLRPFNLDGERTVPATASALTILVAAGLAVAVVRSGFADRRRTLVGLAVVFAFLALDELFAIHEFVEKTAGVNWQVLYAPVGVPGGWLWLLLFLALPGGHPRLLWLLGGASWFVSQVLEFWQWGGDDSKVFDVGSTLLHEWMVLPEEMLELLGSSAFVLALLSLLVARTDPAVTPTVRMVGAPRL